VSLLELSAYCLCCRFVYAAAALLLPPLRGRLGPPPPLSSRSVLSSRGVKRPRKNDAEFDQEAALKHIQVVIGHMAPQTKAPGAKEGGAVGPRASLCMNHQPPLPPPPPLRVVREGEALGPPPPSGRRRHFQRFR
jgi:hypothetical protein